MQRALLPFFKPENHGEVRKALEANDEVKADHYHAVPTPGRKQGKD